MQKFFLLALISLCVNFAWTQPQPPEANGGETPPADKKMEAAAPEAVSESVEEMPQSMPEKVQPTADSDGQGAAPNPAQVKILEDKIKFLEVHKLKELESRLKKLESPLEESEQEKALTPLAAGDKSLWGIGQGFGINFGSVAGNASMGIEIHLFKIMLPQFERPMTHPGSFGISAGIDTWLNTGLEDNENFGYSPYLKLTGNSLVFDNYIRIYGSAEPVLVIGYATSNQWGSDGEPTDNSYFGFRGLFGAEFFASKSYNFFAEVGIMKVNAIDGETPDTGIMPVVRAGPRFWF